MTRLVAGGREVMVFLPEMPTQRVIYLLGCQDIAEEIHGLAPAALLAAVEIRDWNRELSPWSAAAVFRDGGDFTGGATSFLSQLTGVIADIEKQLSLSPLSRCIAGYSLAGLFSLWCLGETRLFDRAASVSGSLWFDGFLDRLKTHPPLTLPERIWLSVGDRERRARNPRMATVEDCTRAAAAHWQSLGTEVRLVLHPGGHFQEVPQRVAEAIRYLDA